MIPAGSALHSAQLSAQSRLQILICAPAITTPQTSLIKIALMVDDDCILMVDIREYSAAEKAIKLELLSRLWLICF